MFRRMSDVGMMLVLKDVRELVRDEPVEQIGRLVDGQQHPVAVAFGKRQHAFLRRAGR